MIEDYLAEMHAESAAPPEDDGPHLIGDDIPCISCSYNLRGLMSDGTCPECGESVARSVKGDYLMYCDPRWVGNLATGMNFSCCQHRCSDCDCCVRFDVESLSTGRGGIDGRRVADSGDDRHDRILDCHNA